MSETPIIAGFYPDPSICKRGDTYYIVNSSFEYLPGLPIHSSTDLVSWRPVSNALTRVSQIAEHLGEASSAIYAPTIRYHDGHFWIVCTNILTLSEGKGHFIIHAEDPAGPWSDPVNVPGVIGMDPDLMWDEKGVCHLTWASFAPTLHGIISAPINPETGEFLEAPKQLWQGTGMASGEGPHLYQKDGWWYVLLAEGGTERGHTATIARARKLDGPFESAPNNPFLTHRSQASPVQNVGHADLIELDDGSWVAVHLGVRPRGKTPRFHTNGRETFLVRINWEDGWPVVDENEFKVSEADHSFIDNFDTDDLNMRWLGVGKFPRSFTFHEAGRGLVLRAPASEESGPSLLAFRAQDQSWSAEIQVDASQGVGRWEIRLDEKHWYGLTVDRESVKAEINIGPISKVVGTVVLTPDASPILRIRTVEPESNPYLRAEQPDLIYLEVEDESGFTSFGPFDGRYLSTEVATGFTGRVVGLEALSGELAAKSVTYTSGV